MSGFPYIRGSSCCRGWSSVLLTSYVVLGLLSAVQAAPFRRTPLGFSSNNQRFTPPNQHPGVNNCDVHWYDQTLDHFGWTLSSAPQTYKQRYFVCDQHWSGAAAKGPVFFYTGNEANVELYVNATGLMWENAAEFGALLIFAEHRYYGESQPPRPAGGNPLQYLSSEQALADYAQLIRFLKTEMKMDPATPVIAFGGSYGGMLSSWMRMKYPSAINGAIAGSAPIWSFLGEHPAIDTGSYAEIVTRDLTPAAGADPGCSDNLRNAWQEILNLGHTAEGKQQLREAMRLCPGQAVETWDDVYQVAFWLQSAFDYMAMGNYPYPSSYILNGDGLLPAYPMRVACERLLPPELQGAALLGAVRDAAAVFYNHTGALPCFNYTSGVNNATQADANEWNYQFCTEMFQPMSRDGVKDAFFYQPFNMTASIDQCEKQFHVSPRPYAATVIYGGKDIASASNIVFSNGFLDPWSGSGVLSNLSDTLVAVEIQEGAHHIDLFWSNPLDPPSVLAARATEKAWMHRWVAEAHGSSRPSQPGPPSSSNQPGKGDRRHRKIVIA